MAVTAITGAQVYYLEGTEVHGDIPAPVRGDLAVYTYAPVDGFIGQEYSYSGTAWFERTSIKQSSSGEPANQVLVGQLGAISGTAAEMAADAAAIILAGTEVANQGKRWENTTDGLVYVFGSSSGSWAYYPESGTDINGYINVSMPNLGATQALYTPARDVFAQWAFGQDDVFSAAVGTGAFETGLALDARHIANDSRSINIIAGGATAYDYQILGGRNNTVGQASVLTTGSVTSITKIIPIAATLGYAPWLFLKLKNTSGDATYKAVLLGKGG